MKQKKRHHLTDTSKVGFTIVELLVVIVVIGILAAITIVSYGGLTNKAVEVSLQSDLTNSSDQLKIYKAYHGSFPTSLDGDDCPLTPIYDTNYCLEASSNNSYTSYGSNGTSFSLSATNDNGMVYMITDSQPPQPKVSLAVSDPANWMTIGTQIWAKFNLNVGNQITGVTEQTDNSYLEKYCYGNDENNCTTYGGLYKWGEVMQYVITEGAQGICPAGSHIPTDAEWTTLETYLGSATAGTQLKPGGASGLNMPLAGYRNSDGSFLDLSSVAILWSSSESGTIARFRNLYSGTATVYRDTDVYGSGVSVRCLEN